MIDFNREEACDRAVDESKRADMKQHADKLIQGFQKLEESHARRALWELFQNAIDLSDQCEVIIRLTNDSLEFSHNGRPFTTNTLSSLIKQVSSKSPTKDNDEVGQYGTGFITTHSFGKEIRLSGSLKENGCFIPFEEFKIDRIAKDSEELIGKLIDQQEEVFKLVKLGEVEDVCSIYTTFSYQTNSSLEKQYAREAISELELILPYVMSINEKLHRVTVIDEDLNKIEYRKGDVILENNVVVTSIHKNQTVKKIFSITSEENNLSIILPLDDERKAYPLHNKLARLFFYYPLIGTENFGFNYIVHSKHFAPTEARDDIYLKSNNEQVQEHESNNRVLLEDSFRLAFQFIKNHVFEIKDVHYLVRLNINTNISDNHLLSEYYKNIKDEWVNQLVELSLVETEEVKITPVETMFFSNELLLDDDYFDSVYSIVSLFWKNIPKKGITKTWTKYVNEWESEKLSFIDIKQIAQKIENVKTLDHFNNKYDLKRFYDYLIKYNHSETFSHYAILPNINNNFRLQSQLNSHIEIDEVLIEIAEVIAPDIPERYLKEGFEFSLTYEPYDRKQFVKEINAKITDYKVDRNSLLKPDILNSIIKYCSIFSSEMKGTRADFLRLLAEYNGENAQFVTLSSNLSDSDWWLTALKCLLRNLIWELNQKDSVWIEENIEFLNRLVSTVHNYYEFNEMTSTLPIFPNQLFELCKKSDLKIDDNIPCELKDLSDKILKPNKEIRENLSHIDFNDYLKNNDSKTPESLGGDIEKLFQLQNSTNTSQHDHIQHILEIIRIISDKPEWAKYFPVIENKKASIMLERISDKETKNDLFSIIGLDKDKISQLGELSRQDNLDRIIELGKAAFVEEQIENTNFWFKHAIGTHIEELVRERIKSDLHDIEVSVEGEQYGQDIVIKNNGIIVYFIEVKSRWNNRSSITMSPMQMKKAVENKSNYALCCVEMSDYKVGDEDRFNVSDINEIIDRINFIKDIGGKIEPILAGTLAVEDTEKEISLIGDYRGLIPQTVVSTGTGLDAFVDDVIVLELGSHIVSGIN